jgi:benzoyl-CoA reductase/2-hydroxyglutaryl-CoA dehydratase subunit BcrC/BadD/HgdB
VSPPPLDLTSSGFRGSVARLAILGRTQVASFQSGTARRYLEHQAIRRSLELYKPGAFVAWTSYLFPPEILAAYRLTPLIPELAATSLMGTELRAQVEAGMNRSLLSRDVCSYHRAALASLEERLLPPPSICLGTDPLCLGKDRLLDHLADRLGVPYVEVPVPLPPDEGEAPAEDVAAVAERLRFVHERLGQACGRSSRLEEAMSYSNRAAAAWSEITSARLEGHLLLNGRQAFAFNFIGQVLRGTEAGAKGFEKLLTQRGRGDLEVSGRPRFRVLWLHTVPHFDQSLVQLVQSRGGVVAFEEMAQMQLDQVDPADPFPGLARRLLEHPLWGTATRRARLTVELARRSQADGAIHFNHWGCRQGLGSVPALRQAFSQAGIPFLAVDGDALAAPGAAEDRGAGQLESFLELLC